MKLIARAREKLRRPWEGKTIAEADLTESFGTNDDRVSAAFALAEQIGPVLAEGTGGNPRQIKRFLNSLLLRLRTAEARGFGKEIKPPVLAKLMVAERFQPTFFDDFARLTARSATGILAELGALEALAQTTNDDRLESAEEGETGSKVAASTVPETWKSEALLRWARLTPSLASEDLRPYLFLTRDRRGFFDGLTLLGHLSVLIDKLMGPEIAVNSLDRELTKLTRQELEQLFDAVRLRVIGTADLSKQPDGVPGLKAVVRASPPLQSRLVDFLQGLPVPRLGTWAVAGWQGTITDEMQRARLSKVIEGWAGSDNKPLAIAAKAAGSVTAVGRRS